MACVLLWHATVRAGGIQDALTPTDLNSRRTEVRMLLGQPYLKHIWFVMQGGVKPPLGYLIELLLGPLHVTHKEFLGFSLACSVPDTTGWVAGLLDAVHKQRSIIARKEIVTVVLTIHT